MLVNMPSSQTKTSLISSMSTVYTGHFRLAIEQFHDTAKAFSIIERARGRSLADSLRYGGRPETETEWEVKISAIQQQIRRNRSPGALKTLLAQLGEAEFNLAGVIENNSSRVGYSVSLRRSRQAYARFSTSSNSQPNFSAKRRNATRAASRSPNCAHCSSARSALPFAL
jgi:hypothetical protein